MALAAWLASTTQVPAALYVRVDPDTLHTPLPLLRSTVKTMDDPPLPVDVDDAVNVAGVPTRPVPGPVKEMTWEPVAVTMESDEVVVEPEPLVATTVKVDVPAVVGVPDRAPAEDNVTPAGNVPVATVYVGAG